MENLIPLVVGLARPNIPATDASLAQLAHAARVNCDGSSIAGESVCSISEIRTQMSEAFWRYGRPDDALNVLKGFETDPRKTYPGEEITQPNSSQILKWRLSALGFWCSLTDFRGPAGCGWTCTQRSVSQWWRTAWLACSAWHRIPWNTRCAHAIGCQPT